MTKIQIYFSGGKDSHACLLLAVEAYGLERCEAVFCDTGWENPLTYMHVFETCDKIGIKLVILKNKMYEGLIDLADKKKRFPSTKARFCTEKLKSEPAIDYVLSHKCNIIAIQGIRWDESSARSKMQQNCSYFKYYFQPYGHTIEGKPKYHKYRKQDVIEWCKSHNADIERPIIDWTAQQTVDYILKTGHSLNPLYYMGFSRVGCFPCIMSRHAETKLIIENHPEQWQKLKDAEQKIGRSFFPPNYIPKRACKNRQYPMAEDIERYIRDKNNSIDMFQQDTPSCMSVYGLCE
jgi:3'-phosphoadenosine 5'-phosphosulfate sulfotransferase (PAPS reductase)/FAD synthetase